MLGEKRKKATIITAIIFAIIISSAAGITIYLLSEPGSFNVFGIPAAPVINVLLFIFSYYFFTRKLRRRKNILKKPFPGEWKQYLKKYIPVYHGLVPAEQESFRRQIQIFLGEKIITGIDTDVDDETKILIAASAIIPVFRLPEWEYDSLGEVLVYPGNFDDNFATDGTHQDILGMVVTGSSSLIISKPALYESFRDMDDGQNVGIHEFMHKIDEEDGTIDGIPALLMDGSRRKEWNDIMKDEMALIEEGSSDINPYALTNPAEFFAVSAEYFFEKPEKMAEKHPRLYEILSAIFRQDLKSILKSVTGEMLKPSRKKTERNSPCPCRSGKKYKHCCLKKRQQ